MDRSNGGLALPLSTVFSKIWTIFFSSMRFQHKHFNLYGCRLAVLTVLFVCLSMTPLVSLFYVELSERCSRFSFFIYLITCHVIVINLKPILTSHAGPRAVNFIIDHAEVDFVFVQDKKVEKVRISHFFFIYIMLNQSLFLINYCFRILVFAAIKSGV